MTSSRPSSSSPPLGRRLSSPLSAPFIRFILAATSAGQLVQLDKRFLDPRRPIVPGGPQKMSAEDREEVREL